MFSRPVAPAAALDRELRRPHAVLPVSDARTQRLQVVAGAADPAAAQETEAGGARVEGVSVP